MSLENLILTTLDNCLKTAVGERLFLWMKAALLYPGLERFVHEVKRADDCQGSVSIESLHKAIEFAESYYEFQIRSLSVPDSEKDEMVRLERFRLKVVDVRMVGC